MFLDYFALTLMVVVGLQLVVDDFRRVFSAPRAVVAGGSGAPAPSESYAMLNQVDAPSCSDCGSIMVRSGTCYRCPNCGISSGCS